MQCHKSRAGANDNLAKLHLTNTIDSIIVCLPFNNMLSLDYSSKVKRFVLFKWLTIALLFAGFGFGLAGILLEVTQQTYPGLFFMLGGLLCAICLALAGVMATYDAKYQIELGHTENKVLDKK